ncbi:MAG: isopentenyl-diphosphate Delta-isomerase [Woeseia sp.]
MQDYENRIVSSDSEQLILVDKNDVEIGYLDKSSCHDAGGILHRAFSLFIFDRDGRLLMQRRSASKRLWPLYWSNSCCSHPRRGESMEEATERRLQDELNIEAELEFVYKFTYQADFGDLGAEHELCWVLLGRTCDAIVANTNEIAATRSLNAAELQQELDVNPEDFTPWFKLEWQRLKERHAPLLQRYLDGG